MFAELSRAATDAFAPPPRRLSEPLIGKKAEHTLLQVGAEMMSRLICATLDGRKTCFLFTFARAIRSILLDDSSSTS